LIGRTNLGAAGGGIIVTANEKSEALS